MPKSKKQREEIRQREQILDRREEALQQNSVEFRKQEKLVENNQRKLAERLEETNRKNEEYTRLIQQQNTELQRITGLSKEEARRLLLANLEQELQSEVGSVILKHERRIAETADEKAKDILLTAMQRYASAHTAETTTSTVDIPNDDMKGRIIGREGRNIRAFEKATGTDVIIDDTPGVVHRERLRPGAPRGCQTVADETDRGRKNPSDPNRRTRGVDGEGDLPVD